MTKWMIASDIHGSEDLWNNIRIKLNNNKDIKTLILCGDQTEAGVADLRCLKNVTLCERMIRSIVKLGVNVYYIHGNHDIGLPKNYFDSSGATGIQDRAVEIDGFSVVGTNLSPCFDLPMLSKTWCNMTHDREIDSHFFNSLEPAEIVISHCPPYGHCDVSGYKDQSIGSPGLLEYIQREEPSYVFCGHVHEESGKESTVGKTKILNVARTCKIVEIEILKKKE